jgi:hypothetical protein
VVRASSRAATACSRFTDGNWAKEFIESLAAFEIVEERLDRHAGVNKDRHAAEDVGVAVYDLAELGHAGHSVWHLGV